jgi:hypothetical protein
MGIEWPSGRVRRLLGTWALAAGIGCAGTTAPEAQSAYPTNFELVRQAASKACLKLSRSLQDAAVGEATSVRAIGDHAGNFLVESALSEVLTQAGLPVRVETDSIGPLLEFEVVDLGIAYTDVRRRAWLGSRRVEREARARVFARLVDQSRSSIVWSNQVEDKVVDEVPHSELRGVEERSDADYLKATLPAQSWNKFVEPVVVSGIVLGLIALFFSNQNASN